MIFLVVFNFAEAGSIEKAVLDEVVLFVQGSLPLLLPSLYTLRKKKPAVSNNSLDTIMGDTARLDRLIEFMRKEFSVENLMFYRVCAMLGNTWSDQLSFRPFRSTEQHLLM